MATRLGGRSHLPSSLPPTPTTSNANPNSAMPPINSHRFQPCPLDHVLRQQGLTRYHLEPPSWRPPWLPAGAGAGGGGASAASTSTSSSSSSAEPASTSIYPQFYAPCDGQEEDQLTETAVKTGFGGKNVVQTETFSAHQLIYEKLKSEDILGNLSRLSNAVRDRAQQLVPTYGPPSFKLPKRNIVTDTKREQWFTDLSNPAVPLSKLFSIVPHGYRGQQILEMFYSKKVPCSRAIWFVRAFGALEIQNNIAKRPASAPSAVASYTLEWTLIVQEFVRKQLAEIATDEPQVASSTSPTTATHPLRMSLSAKAQAKQPVMMDDDLRNAWTMKFSYTLRLLEALYEEHLLDSDSFLRFLVNQIESSNIGQLPLALFLAEEYLGEFLLSEPLSARLVAACFARLDNLSSFTTPAAIHSATMSTLTSLIRSTFVALPDAFIAAPLWSQYASSLTNLLDGLDDPVLIRTVRADLSDLKVRSEAASKGTEDEDSSEPDDIETIHLLDSIAFPALLTQVHKSLFHKRRRKRGLQVELPLMFTWATCGDRAGPYRRYAVATLIAMEKDGMEMNEQPRVDIERVFIDWIDQGARTGGARKAGDEGAEIRLLLEELIRCNVIGYSSYLQRMIARGETEEKPSIHLKLLKTVALHDESGRPLAKKRMALKSSPASRNEGEHLLGDATQELQRLVPSLVDGQSHPLAALLGDRDCTTLLGAIFGLSKDGTHLVLQRDTIPAGLARLLRPKGEHMALTAEEHAILTQTYLVVEDYFGLLQYIFVVLIHAPTRDVLSCVLDLIEGNLDCWTALDALPTLGQALLIAHEGLKVDGVNDRRLIALLRQFGQAQCLDASNLTKLEQDYQELVLQQSLPAGMPELQGLLIDSSPQAIAQLGTTLWYRYHAFENWAVIAIESGVQLLAGVSASTIVRFLREINERLPTGLEAQIGKWVAQMPSYSMIATFGAHLSSGVASLLLELVTGGILSPLALITLVILPVWKTLFVAASLPTSPASPTPIQTSSLDATLLQALDTITHIFGSLITRSSHAAAGLALNEDLSNTPAALLHRQRGDSRCANLFTQASLGELGKCVASLAVQQDFWTNLGQHDRAQATGMLLMHLNSWPAFQAAVVRDPQVFASAVLDSAPVVAVPLATSAHRPKLLAALLLTLKDSSTAIPASLVSTEDWDLFLSGLTTWRLAVSKVEVQACLERLDLDSTISDAEKAEGLNALSRHFLDRVCSGEGHTYLGEQIVKCYHGHASDELVSVAFSRLAEAVDGLARTASIERRMHSLTTLRCTGRLLNTLLQSSSASSQAAPLHQLLTAIRCCLEGLVDEGVSSPREAVLHSAHLLAIALRCSATVSPSAVQTANLFKGCLIPCTKLAAIFCRDCPNDVELSSVLLDTCSHLLFGLTDLAPSVRLPSIDSIIAPEVELDSLSEAALSRLGRLFDASGSALPVANPWDLVDHADPGPPQTTRHNSGPLDLAWFDAKIVIVIPPLIALDVHNGPPSSGATTNGNSYAVAATPFSTAAAQVHAITGHQASFERGRQSNFDFETPCIAMSVAARDHRRTLMAAKAQLSKYDPNNTGKHVLYGTAVNSPAAGTPTGSAAVPQASTATSPSVHAKNREEALAALASASASNSTKRKDPPEVVVIDSDEEDEPIAQIVAAKAPAAKRGRPSTRGGASAARKKAKT
ncbi:BQ2448_1103 [Microbotryum intermedium]|uniref:Mediator of RNA polymerase II transcription subunit 12 n=1 Tax=Microbotryum intermedium TaxID=269621 RepID=A0A238FAB7_9BASI|nr:BQ2448_1103 [Microbotryum intermedium]